MIGPQWFLVQTHGNMERVARDALQSPYRKCKVSLPLEVVTVVHARRKVDKERAFFARYLFVLDQGQGLPVIRTAPGVSHLPRRGLDPIMVPQSIVEHVEQRVKLMNDGFYNKRAFVAERFHSGDVVRVTDGPFASFEGLFECDYNTRAKIAVNIFGRTTPVELEYDQFEAA